MSLPGYWQCPNKNDNKNNDVLEYVQCKGNGKMCLGRNMTVAPSVQNQSQMCGIGRMNPSTTNVFCQTCQLGYVPDGSTGCSICKDRTGKKTFVAFVIIMVSFIFVVLIVFKVKGAGKAMAIHSTLKRTLLTHLQMLGIVVSLNLPFPTVVVSFVDGLTAVVLFVGQSASAHCSNALPNRLSSRASFHYGLTIAAVLLPLCIVCISYIYWILLVKNCTCLACGTKLEISHWKIWNRRGLTTEQAKEQRESRARPQMMQGRRKQEQERRRRARSSIAIFTDSKSTLDGFIVTLVYFCYLSLPTIIRMCLNTFNYEKVCGTLYFAEDYSIKYFSTEHTLMLFLIAMPGLIVYGVLVLLFTICYLYKHQDLLSSRRMTMRVGLLYSGYKKNMFWWEVIGKSVGMICFCRYCFHRHISLTHFH